MVKLIHLVSLFIIINVPVFAQERKDLSFSFALGPSISYEYKNPSANYFQSFDMDYYFQKRHIISANYYTGSHSLPPTSSMGYTQSAHYTAISLLYKYRFIDNPNFPSLPEQVGERCATGLTQPGFGMIT